MEIKVKISEDEKQAVLSVITDKDSDEIPIIDNLKDELNKAGVTTGIDESQLSLICFDKKFNEEIVAAKYIEPETGQNATMEEVNAPVPKEKIKPILRDDGSVDYYTPRKGFITFVRKGETIVKKIPLTVGLPGLTVTGKEIPGISGEDILIEQFCGPNTGIKEDSIIAVESGIVKITDKRYSVEKEFMINTDIGVETGSIDLPLDADVELTVKGDIQDGYKVSCPKLKVSGCVEDAEINVKSLQINEGIVGTSELPINADLIRVEFVNGPRKISAKYIKVLREISNGAEVTADIVHVNTIRGSNIIAKEGIWTDNISGSNDIYVGIDYDVKKEFDRLSVEINMIKKNIEEMKNESYKIAKKMEKLKQLAKINPKNPMLIKELEGIKKFKTKFDSETAFYNELKENRNKAAEKMYLFKDSFLLVRAGFTDDESSGQIISLDTSLHICRHLMKIVEPTSGGVYTADEGEIHANSKYNIAQYKNIMENKTKSLKE